MNFTSDKELRAFKDWVQQVDPTMSYSKELMRELYTLWVRMRDHGLVPV